MTANSYPIAGLLILVAALTGCMSQSASSPLLAAEPSEGARLERPPRTLRLYYRALPDVDASSLSLHGPRGEQNLRGLHTMAADDLMVEIMDPLVPGEYEVRWATRLEGESDLHSGAYRFIVLTP